MLNETAVQYTGYGLAFIEIGVMHTRLALI